MSHVSLDRTKRAINSTARVGRQLIAKRRFDRSYS
jgi:hypothetical protein